MHIIAAKAVCFHEALQPEFKDYAAQIIQNCKALANELENQGFRLVAGGTDNHLLLVDVKHSVGLSGKEAEKLLDEVHITCNKNAIPFDTERPMITSGIRLGTAAMTTKGYTEKEFIQIAKWISDVLKNPEDEALKERIRSEVIALTEQFVFE